MTALMPLTSAPDSSVAPTSHPVLSITHGLHQGVSLPLDKAAYTIGSAEHADLLLSDAGIAERHLRLRFSDDHVAVEALGGDVSVIARGAREVVIPKGRGHRARLPLELRIGDARLTLKTGRAGPGASPTSAPKPLHAWLRKPQWIVALVLLFLCFAAFAFRGQPLPEARSAASQDFSAQPNNQPVQGIQPLQRSSQAAKVTEARAWLEQQLSTARLNQIKVNEVDGQLSVQGSFDPANKSQWMSVQQAYDARFGQQVMMHPSVVARAEMAKPRVRFQAVWFGANPYVVNESGKRLYPGAALADDWMLERIENNQVVLARGEERFTFTL